jgi:hypothetical protein
MDTKLHHLLEALDSCLAESIDKLEELTPDLEDDSDAFIADAIRYLAEDIRGMINQEEEDE